MQLLGDVQESTRNEDNEENLRYWEKKSEVPTCIFVSDVLSAPVTRSLSESYIHV